MKREEFDDRYAASQLARSASPLRKRVKQFYLDRVLAHVVGPTLDVGCGAGQLLEQLPPGSMGLEINPPLVSRLVSMGLRVSQIESKPDRIDLGNFPKAAYHTVVLSHVLEHFENAAAVLRHMLSECAARGVERVIIVVPGEAGYRSDPTHKTLVTLKYLERENLTSEAGFVVTHRSWFPGNFESVGRFFIYHELMLVFDRAH